MSKIDPKLFDSSEIAFKSRSDKELKKTYKLFRMMSNRFLNPLGIGLLKFSVFIKLPIETLAGKLLFSHFCGGDDLESSKEHTKGLYSHNVQGVLDYSAEGKETEESFESITEEIIKIIDNVVEDRKRVPFAVFKMSGISSNKLMSKIQRKESLTEAEKLSWKKVKERVDRICSYAYTKKVPIMVDAEKLDVQYIIDELIYEMMEKYNKEMPLIYNTIQFYRKDSYKLFLEAYKKITEKGLYFGLKLVRGAYLEEEKERAAKEGKENPIHDTKENTDKAYNDALKFCIEHIDKMGVFSGTHNLESTLYLIELMEEHNIANNDKRVYFSQLY
jgi:proline dehydrogenase